MSELLERALKADVGAAASAATSAAVNEASRQADLLLGGRPLPGSAQWTAEQDSGVAAERDVAAQVARLRIELAVGVDAFGSVLGLRRWGVTWEVIAKASGVTRQAAHERWGRRVMAVLDAYGTGELGGPVADDEADLRRV